MIIEKTPIKIAKISLDQVLKEGFLVGAKNRDRLRINPVKMDFLKLLTQGKSIFDIAQSYLANNVLICFKELHELLTFMAAENLLLTPEVVSYLVKQQPEEKGLFEEFVDKLLGEEEKVSARTKLKSLPFFRTLSPLILKVFMENLTITQVPKSIVLCREGSLQRGLFVLIKGQASVYKSIAGKKVKVATLPEGSVFGETGFFMQEPRTADVITDTDAVLARIAYVPEIFDDLIQKDKAQQLQTRFWMIHALLKSQFFKDLPTDCFDALLFSGDFKKFIINEPIIRERDGGLSCFILVQGSVEVSMAGQRVRILKQGDCFGEVALILSKGVRTATVTAQSEVLVLEIPAKNFYRLMSENLLLACQFEDIAISRIKNESLK